VGRFDRTPLHNACVRIGIIDVGSNTMRLLVADPCPRRGLQPLHQAKARVGLAEPIQRVGHIPQGKLDEAEQHARLLAGEARARGCASLEVIVTAPGRQSSNADELLVALQRATGRAPRVLSGLDEGRYAHRGAVVDLTSDHGDVAVFDVGGGSTEIAIGGVLGAEWLASLDAGSLGLTVTTLGDAPGRSRIKRARRAIRAEFASLDVPECDHAVAVGGSARALGRIVDGPLTPEALGKVISQSQGASIDQLARRYSLGAQRARTVLAGAIILAEAARVAGRPLDVSSTGLREGLAAELLELRAA